MRVTEVIHVNHELDLLEAHVAEASEYADRIVIKEGECTWNGVPKPLHVTDNWSRFSKYPKAEVLVLPESMFFKNPADIKEMRLNENGTRYYGWENVSEGADYVIECDVDEIIDRRRVSALYDLMDTGEYLHISIKYENRIWYMNNKLRWHTPYRVFKTGEPEIMLNPKHRKRCGAPNIGWHFSGCVGDEGWERKYTDMNFIYGFTPRELERIDWPLMRREKLYLDKHRNLKPLGGEHELEVNLDEYPQFVRETPELFPWFGDVHFF